MPNHREKAHSALRTLWQAADERLREEDVVPHRVFVSPQRGWAEVTTVKTDGGATIRLVGGQIKVEGEFENASGADETIRVEFPPDIRDLADSQVHVDWRNEEGSGTNTPKMSKIPGLAEDLLALI